MNVKHKNGSETFRLLVSLGSAYDGENFTIVFSTGKLKLVTYTCSYDGSTYTNCEKVDDTHILCTLDNAGFPDGMLVASITVEFEDSKLEDGTYEVGDTRLVEALDENNVPYHIMITQGASDTLTTPEIVWTLLGTVLHGETGPAGADGLTTKVKVNGTTYEQVDGLIDLGTIGGGTSGVPEAPADGKTYARKDVAWVEVTSMTADEKTKLAGIEAGAEVNVQADWNETDSSKDNYIQNKPTIPSSASDIGAATASHTHTKSQITDFPSIPSTASDISTTEGISEGKNVQADLNQIARRIDDIEVPSGGGIVETKYAELKAMRDASTLAAGTWYKITDYECTTSTAGTTSAGHQFDIIVRADSTSVLNENAFAALHEGDTYFSSCKLEAWKLKYCLDNDTDRFAWAYTDITSVCKGIIYYMKDEFNNECPYDFKNIQFYRSYDEDTGLYSIINGDATGVACYTFSNYIDSTATDTTDTSLTASNYIYGNVIKDYIDSGIIILNNNCFFGKGCYSNTFRTGCYSNTFGTGCYSNTFGEDCYSNKFGEGYYFNTFGEGCYSNTFGEGCYSNTFGEGCSSNTFGEFCYSNTFGEGCSSNTFGDFCYSNTFGEGCSSNTFGYYCYSNTFGEGCSSNTFVISCYSNTFGTGCYSNTFGKGCYSNTFGKDCYSNTFGEGCSSNTFGEGCSSNTFGKGCSSNTFGKGCVSNTLNKSYSSCNEFRAGVSYVTLDSTNGTTSSRSRLKNIVVYPSKSGTSSAKTIIDIPSSDIGTTTTIQYGSIETRE